MWQHFFRGIVLSLDPTGSAGETPYYLPAANAVVRAVPWVRGRGDSIVEDINGVRLSNVPEPKVHFDVEIAWEELEDEPQEVLFNFVKDYMTDMATTVRFRPSPDGTPSLSLDPIEVVPVLTGEIMQMQWETRIRKRPAQLELRGKEPVLVVDFPSWFEGEHV